MSILKDKQKEPGQKAPPNASPIQIGLFSKKIQAVEKNPVCVGITDPIPSGPGAEHPVKQVTFAVKSNDQGWSNEDNFTGNYEGSWTWLEVAILRPANGDPKPTLDYEPCIRKYLVDNKIKETYKLLIPAADQKPKPGPFWHLQRNRRAKEKQHEHKIEWKSGATESETERLGWDFDPGNGQGSGVAFVESLQTGDRIALVARAKQSGWVNHVSGASIHILPDGLELESKVEGNDPASIPHDSVKNTAGHPPPASPEVPANASLPDAKNLRGDESTASQGGRLLVLEKPAPDSTIDTTVIPSQSSGKGGDSGGSFLGQIRNRRKNSGTQLPSTSPQPSAGPNVVIRGWKRVVSGIKSLRKQSISEVDDLNKPENSSTVAGV